MSTEGDVEEYRNENVRKIKKLIAERDEARAKLATVEEACAVQAKHAREEHECLKAELDHMREQAEVDCYRIDELVSDRDEERRAKAWEIFASELSRLPEDEPISLHQCADLAFSATDAFLAAERGETEPVELEPEEPASLLGQSITDLGISEGVVKALAASHVTLVGELVQMSAHGVISVHGIGVQSLHHIQSQLRKHSLRLAMTGEQLTKWRG